MNVRAHAILIVDDEPEVLESLRRLLRNEPYRVVTTTSPHEALTLLAANPFDVLISDIDMPEMSGVELIKRARAAHPEVVRILLTGGASLDSALSAINEGEVHRYLTKPWQKQELRETLRATVARLEELRRASAAAHQASLRERIRLELEREHPGITVVEKQDGAYAIDVERLGRLTAALPGLSAFFHR